MVLLDERRLEILIQPKLYAGELLDLVASHFNLKEKEYFGLAFHDETDQCNWLQLDRRVLDQDIPKKNNQSPLILYFLVKFFIESIVNLRDCVTVELFYLQAKSLIFKGQIEADSDTTFQLAANVLQATHGDHVDDATAKSSLKKLPILPTSTLKEHPSLSYCEDKVLAHYKKLSGQSKGYCIVNYMTIVEGLPTYGIHYFEVKDKGGIPWWLGLSCKGIAQYDFADKKTPRRVFQWKQLENLYFRDRKFSIEVHDPKRVSVSRRTFGPGNVTVHIWFTSSPQLTRCIWSMAISQHQFYLDKKNNKSSPARCLSDIVNELTQLHLVSNENKLNNNSEHLVNADSIIQDTDFESEVSRAARLEMLSALKARKDALEAKLNEKTDELKLLCVKEAELIGELPPEIPLAPGESLPAFRKRVGTAFSLPENLINRLKSKEEEVLSKLELEYEIQSRIINAAHKLANDVAAKKNIRKQRKLMYQQSVLKLKDIEQRLIAVRKAVAQKKARNQIKKKQPRPSSDGEDHNDDNYSHSTEENDLVFPKPSPSLALKKGIGSGLEDAKNQVNRIQQDTYPDRHIGAPSPATSSISVAHGPLPPGPMKQGRNSGSSRTSSPSSNRFSIGGYIPNAVYQTKSSYRTQQYPTFSTRSHSSSSRSNSSHSDYDNVHFMTGNNPVFRNKYDASIPMDSRGLYSVAKQQTSQPFPSQDELDAPPPHPIHHSHSLHGKSQQYRQHQSFKQNRYGSLDRTLYGTHGNNTIMSTNSGSTSRIESRSLDNLDCGVQHDCQLSPGMSRETMDISLSRDYLENPVVPHPGGNISYYEVVDENFPKQYAEHMNVLHPLHVRDQQQMVRPDSLNYSSAKYGGRMSHPHRGASYSPQEEFIPSNVVYHPISSKSKEWYESSLDSPIQSRKQIDVKPPKHPTSPLMAPLASEEPSPKRSMENPDNSAFVNVPYETPQNQVIITQGQFQPYREITKPYELADYYKYSTKVRKQSQSSAKSETGSIVSNYSNSSLSSSSHPPSLNISIDIHSPCSASPFPSPLSPSVVQRGSYVKTKREHDAMHYNAETAVPKSPSVHSRQGFAGGAMSAEDGSSSKPHYPGDGSEDAQKMHGSGNSASLVYDSGMSLADAFHDEMLAWYEDQDVVKQATLV